MDGKENRQLVSSPFASGEVEWLWNLLLSSWQSLFHFYPFESTLVWMLITAALGYFNTLLNGLQSLCNLPLPRLITLTLSDHCGTSSKPLLCGRACPFHKKFSHLPPKFYLACILVTLNLLCTSYLPRSSHRGNLFHLKWTSLPDSSNIINPGIKSLVFYDPLCCTSHILFHMFVTHASNISGIPCRI